LNKYVEKKMIQRNEAFNKNNGLKKRVEEGDWRRGNSTVHKGGKVDE